jgi:AcrR family transcriptional regulator
MDSKPNKRKLQAQETRNRIFEIAVRLIEKEGFENISIEQISSMANVSVGAFYHHFASKNDLLLEIYKRGDAYFKEKVAGHLVGDTTEQLILDYFDHFARFYISMGVDHNKALFKTQSKIFLNKERFIVSMLYDLVEQGKKHCELVDELSVDQITDFLLSAARGLAFTWCLHDGEYPFEEALHTHMAYFLKSLRAKG